MYLILGRVKSKTIKLVFTASLLDTQHALKACIQYTNHLSIGRAF
jgi:hypothetical protein